MDSNHWDQIYSKKADNEVSWFEESPEKSLTFIEELKIKSNDPIIDIGGGNSRLIDELLEKGYQDITLLDISPVALEQARGRLGPKGKSIKFISTDITKFRPTESYMLWHDRAAFHFLTTKSEIEKYLEVASESIRPEGFLIVSTFSKTGPQKCSGLAIKQYSDEDLKNLFSTYFENTKCIESSHTTPWGTVQNFVYCGFRRKQAAYQKNFPRSQTG